MKNQSISLNNISRYVFRNYFLFLKGIFIDVLKMNKKILYLVTEDWYFLSHRLPLALASKNSGYEVYVACKDTGKMDQIKQHDFHCFNLNIKGVFSILNVFRNILEVRGIIKKVDISILHAVSMQSIILGLMATFFNTKIKFVASVTGLGTLFLVNSLKANIIKYFIIIFFSCWFQKKEFKGHSSK